jgi:hypothetical protein
MGIIHGTYCHDFPLYWLRFGSKGSTLRVFSLARDCKLRHQFADFVGGFDPFAFISQFQLRFFGSANYLLYFAASDQPVDFFQILASGYHPGDYRFGATEKQ